MITVFACNIWTLHSFRNSNAFQLAEDEQCRLDRSDEVCTDCHGVVMICLLEYGAKTVELLFPRNVVGINCYELPDICYCSGIGTDLYLEYYGLPPFCFTQYDSETSKIL